MSLDYVPTPHSDYSPDELERSMDAIDQAEQEARHRTIANGRHAGTEVEER